MDQFCSVSCAMLSMTSTTMLKCIIHCLILLMVSARPIPDGREEQHHIVKPSEYFFCLESDVIPSPEDKFYMCTGPCSDDENCQSSQEEKIKESAINNLTAQQTEVFIKRRKRQEFFPIEVRLYLHCRGPCINELPTANCSPERKRIRLEEGNKCGGEGSSGESTLPDECKNGNGANSENKLAVDTDMKSQTTETSKECYFKHERVNPDGLEKKERPPQSKVSMGCCGTLQR